MADEGGREEDNRFDIRSEGYPSLASISYYPWDYIVEPFRKTLLGPPPAMSSLLLGSVSWELHWTISREREEGGARIIEAHLVGPEVAFTFSEPTQVYDILLEARDAGRGEVMMVAAAHVMCKYVRREIRSLSEADRQVYFEALAKVGSLELEAGQTMLGKSFKNLQYFMVKHIHNQDCSPFHNGNSFFTAHAAFTLELDQALQSTAPMILQPYWDYTIDASLYGSDWYTLSPLFRDDW